MATITNKNMKSNKTNKVNDDVVSDVDIAGDDDVVSNAETVEVEREEVPDKKTKKPKKSSDSESTSSEQSDVKEHKKKVKQLKYIMVVNDLFSYIKTTMLYAFSKGVSQDNVIQHLENKKDTIVDELTSILSKKKKTIDMGVKVLSAYQLYAAERRAELKEEPKYKKLDGKDRLTEMNRTIAREWKDMTDDDKSFYNEESSKRKAEYNKKIMDMDLKKIKDITPIEKEKKSKTKKVTPYQAWRRARSDELRDENLPYKDIVEKLKTEYAEHKQDDTWIEMWSKIAEEETENPPERKKVKRARKTKTSKSKTTDDDGDKSEIEEDKKSKKPKKSDDDDKKSKKTKDTDEGDKKSKKTKKPKETDEGNKKSKKEKSKKTKKKSVKSDNDTVSDVDGDDLSLM